ncbi:MAG: putative methylase [Thermoplasmata archaeon]|nr:putative methylase [Thermoplasmata archaeon]
MRRKDLEARLEAVPRHPAPRPELEQYRTPSGVAAELLLHAEADGAVRDKRVLDLGCGTGLFAVGAALLGARLATGVDVDTAAIGLAQQAAAHAGVQTLTWFVAADLRDWKPEPATYDTVVMNPPFGAQAGGRHADRLFLQRAAEAVAPGGGTVWFLAQERTERFLAAFAKELKGNLERVAVWDYPLEATMEHHKDEVRMVRVGGYRLGFA